MFAEVVVGKLQQGLADLQAEPDDRPANEGGRPVDGADHPGPAQRRQLAGRRLIQQKRGIGVLLQKAGRDSLGHAPFRRLVHDGGLVLAEGHDGDLARLQDGADTHGQGLVRHVLFAEKIVGSIPARNRVERNHSGPAMARRARLVEADVPAAADPQNLQVDAPRPPDLLLVAGTVFLHLRMADGAVRNVDVRGRDIDVVEKNLLHPEAITVRIVRRHRKIFVQVECDDAGEIQAGFLVQADELAIQSDRRRAGGQTQHRGPARRIILPDQAFDHQGQVPRSLHARRKYQGRYLGVWKVMRRHRGSVFRFLLAFSFRKIPRERKTQATQHFFNLSISKHRHLVTVH